MRRVPGRASRSSGNCAFARMGVVFPAPCVDALPPAYRSRSRAAWTGPSPDPGAPPAAVERAFPPLPPDPAQCRAACTDPVMHPSRSISVDGTCTTSHPCRAVMAARGARPARVSASSRRGRPSLLVHTEISGSGTAFGSVQRPAYDPCANAPGAVPSVDSSHADDRIAARSSRGPAGFDSAPVACAMAPGDRVVVLLANHYTTERSASSANGVLLIDHTRTDSAVGSNDWYRLSGIYVAAPVAAGAAASTLQVAPCLAFPALTARPATPVDDGMPPDAAPIAHPFGAGLVGVSGPVWHEALATQAAEGGVSQGDDQGNVFDILGLARACSAAVSSSQVAPGGQLGAPAARWVRRDGTARSATADRVPGRTGADRAVAALTGED